MADASKKILICIDWFCPAYKAGGPVQSCKNMVEALGGRFEFYIYTSDRDEGDTAPFSDIRFNEWVTYAPHVYVFYAHGKMPVKGIMEELQPAVVYFNSMYSFPFTIKPLLVAGRLKNTPALVLAPRGMLQTGAMQFKKGKKLLFLRLIRLLRLHRRIYFQATDVQEKSDILHYFPRPKGVFEAGNFAATQHKPWQQTAKQAGTLKCVFLSRIVPKKNLLFLLELLGGIPVHLHIHLDVWGSAEDGAYLEACRNAAAALPAHVQVRFMGPVQNSELERAYTGAHIFVLPTLGENYGHAINEAMLFGKPVIISTETPWRNLQEAGCGFDIPLSQPEAFANAVVAFAAMDQDSYNQWSRDAEAFARKRNSNAALAEQYDQFFHKISSE